MEGKALMLKERRSEIERLYFSASELEPAARVAYLERMCGSDLDLRREGRVAS